MQIGREKTVTIQVDMKPNMENPKSSIFGFMSAWIVTVLSLPICIAFTSFPYLTVVTMTSHTVLNGNSKCRHPCFVPEFSKKAFSFSLLSIVLASGLL